jgi:hypothetical protein
MTHQSNGATHAHIKCSRRFYQGTETRRRARNGQVRGTKADRDDCLAREAYVRSSTTLDIFSLEVQVPDTIVKVHTSDISSLIEYAWYEWVKFRY